MRLCDALAFSLAGADRQRGAKASAALSCRGRANQNADAALVRAVRHCWTGVHWPALQPARHRAPLVMMTGVAASNTLPVAKPGRQYRAEGKVTLEGCRQLLRLVA